MGKSKKGGLLSRQRAALQRLENQYKTFVAAKEDKPARVSHKWVNGRSVEISHPGRPYAEECARLKKEIENLTHNMNKNVK